MKLGVRQKFLALPPPAETFSFDDLPSIIPMGI